MIDQSFASPLQGVSQQSTRDRLDGQCASQINLIADPVKLLTRRPPLNYKKSFGSIPSTVQKIDFSFMDKDYVFFCDDTYLALYNQTDDITLTPPGTVPNYVSNDLTLAVANDTIFLCNRNVITAMDTYVQPYTNEEALVYCKGGNVDYTYELTVVGDNSSFFASYTPDTSANASGSNITQELYNDLSGNASFLLEFSIDLQGDVILITRLNGERVEATVADGLNGEDLILVIDSIEEPGDLPAYATDGYVVVVTSLASISDDDWYLEFVQETPGFGNPGVWVESTKPGLANYFDTTTMPYVINIDSDTNSFEVVAGDWFERRVGDEESAKTPSFVGKTINSIYAFQNRLGMFADTFFFTRTDAELDCWRESASDVIADSDPIDIYSSITSPKKIYNTIGHNRGLLPYSSDTQFLIAGDTRFTPTSAAVAVNSHFTADTVKPLTTGFSVVHSYPYGEYSGLLEIFPGTYSDSSISDKLTAHVSSYIEGNVKQLVGSNNFDYIFVTAENSKRIYTYKYLYAGEKKVQSAWGFWEFPVDIEYIYSREDVLFVIYTVDGITYLGEIQLDMPSDTPLGYTIYLDHRQEVDVVDGVFTTNVPIVEGTKVVMACDDYLSGTDIGIVSVVGDVVTLEESVTCKAITGLPVSFEYVPNVPQIKDEKGIVIGTGKLKVTNYITSVQDTGTFFIDYIIDKDGTVVGTKEISSNIADTDDEYDKVNLLTDTLTIPFYRDTRIYNIKFRSDDYYPFTMLDLEWVGRWFKVGRRI